MRIFVKLKGSATRVGAREEIKGLPLDFASSHSYDKSKILGLFYFKKLC